MIAFRGRLAIDEPTGHAFAELVTLLPKRKDAELARILASATKPVTLKDEQFGKLTMDRRFNTFNGRTVWAGRKVRLNLDASRPDDVAASLQTARALWADTKTWTQRINDYVVAHLLERKNTGWLGDDERPLTTARFVKRMKLKSVCVRPDGRFEFWHDDGGLFWGHAIHVSGDLKHGPMDVDTPG